MGIDRYLADKTVIRCTPDERKARALRANASRTLVAIKALEPGPLTVTNAYSALRQILEAMTLLRGLKFYSHEAYTAYLNGLGEERAAATFDRYRVLRNRIEYDGRSVGRATAEEALREMELLVRLLRKKYLEDASVPPR